MKAVLYTGNAGAGVQVIVNSRHPNASIKLHSRHLLVKVYTASYNHLDFIKAQHSRRKRAWCPGRSICGEVVAVGTKCSLGFEVGDEVVGFVRNALSEYVSAEEDSFIKRPAALSHTDAAAFPYSGLAGFQAVRYYAEVEPTEEVLVLDAMTSVGNVTVQVCKCIKGTSITATTCKSGIAVDVLKSYGVQEVVSYTNRNPNWWSQLRNRKFDVIIDCGIGEQLGEKTWERALMLLRKGNGRFVSFQKLSASKLLYRSMVTASKYFTYIQCKIFPDYDHLRIIAKLVRKRRLRIGTETDGTPFEFDQADAREMMKRAGMRKTMGNLIMMIDEDRSFEETPLAPED